MSSRQFILMVLVLFTVGAMPFLIVQPTAAASAGLSLGFSAPLDHSPMLVVLALLGIMAAALPRDGLLLMPVAFALMIMLGGMIHLDVGHHVGLRYFILGAVLCMGLLIGIVREKLTILMVLTLASLGFHFGGFYMQAVPIIATPMYYLLGVLLSLVMILAISVAFGATVIGDNERTWQRIKQSPRFAFIRQIFL